MRRLVFISLAFITFMTVLLTTIVFAQSGMIISGDDDAKKIKVVDVKNPYVGIYMDEVSRKVKERLDYPKSGGVWIMEVVEDSPADRAGLEDDDIIYMIDGDRIKGVDELKEILAEREAGDTIDMVVYREGEKKEFRLELGERARQYYTIDMDELGERLGQEWGKRSFTIQKDDYDDDVWNYAIGSSFLPKGRLRLGVQIFPMSEDLAEYFDIKDGKGVLVLDVAKDSPAEEAGMKGGDVIVAVGDIAVEDGEDLLEALGDYDEEDEAIKVTAIRKGDRKVFDFKVEDLIDDEHTQIWIGPGNDFKHFKVNIPNWSEQKKLEQLKAESLGEGMELDKLREEIEILEKRLKRLEKDKE